MTIAKGRTSFEYYLDESFIVLERYLDLVPVLILESKESQIKETEKIIADEKDPDVKESMSTLFYRWNRFEDFDEMPDIFYKSFLISLCNFCESFTAKLHEELSILNKIKKTNESGLYFKDYWTTLNKYIDNESNYFQTNFYKVFELRNLIVHGNSLLVKPKENDKNFKTLLYRNLIVNQFVEVYPESIKIKNDNKLIICDNKFLKNSTSIIHNELSIILSQIEIKLSKLNLYIDPFK